LKRTAGHQVNADDIRSAKNLAIVDQPCDTFVHYSMALLPHP